MNNTVNANAFSLAVASVLDDAAHTDGIGTLSEKSLHRILKYAVDPDRTHHEIPVLGSIADVKNDKGITEIQTRGFDKLLPKLRKFLPEYPVNVVYPVIVDKEIIWLDRESGEIKEIRKSPKHATPASVLSELYHITELLQSENLTVTLTLLRATDYKELDGYGKDSKIRATRIDRLPTEIVGEISLFSVADVCALVKNDLPALFTAKELDRVTRLRGRRAYYALRALVDLGVVRRVGNRARAYLYSFA